MSIRDRIAKEEGWSATAYKDTRGVWTVGYGFNIDKDYGGGLPKEIGDLWLDWQIKRCEAALDKVLPWWRGRPDRVREAMVLMVYQLGMAGLLGFQRMLAALHAGDYNTASAQALDSDWAEQTPARAARVAALFRGETNGQSAQV